LGYSGSGVEYSTLSDVAFVSTLEGWVVSSSNGHEVYHTLDSGNSWVAQYLPSSCSLNGVCFFDASHGWAVGALGEILRYVP